MNPVQELRKRVLARGGKKFVKGALSRLAEHLQCSRSTVRMYFIGDSEGNKWTVSKKHSEILQRVITEEIPLEAIKPGPKCENNSCL